MPQHKPRNPACTVAHICTVLVCASKKIAQYVQACTIAHIHCYAVFVSTHYHCLDKISDRAAPNCINRIYRKSKNIHLKMLFLLLTSTHQFADILVPGSLVHAHKCTPCTCMCPELSIIKPKTLLLYIKPLCLTCLKSLQKGIFSSPSFLSAGCLNLHRSPL